MILFRRRGRRDVAPRERAVRENIHTTCVDARGDGRRRRRRGEGGKEKKNAGKLAGNPGENGIPGTGTDRSSVVVDVCQRHYHTDTRSLSFVRSFVRLFVRSFVCSFVPVVVSSTLSSCVSYGTLYNQYTT